MEMETTYESFEVANHYEFDKPIVQKPYIC